MTAGWLTDEEFPLSATVAARREGFDLVYRWLFGQRRIEVLALRAQNRHGMLTDRGPAVGNLAVHFALLDGDES